MPSANLSQDGRSSIAGSFGGQAENDLLATIPYVGTLSVTGSNTIAATVHGFTTPVSVIVSISKATAPTAIIATYAISSGTVTVYLWMATDATTTTLIADTAATTVTVMIWGT